MPEPTPTETPVFTREYRNAVDAQWRVTVPSAWRFADRAEFYIRVKKDHLEVFPRSELDRFLAWANALPGADRVEALEHWGATTEQVKIDSAGRLTLPSAWAKLVGLDVKKNAVLRGAIVNFKIWDETNYDATSADRRVRGNALLERYDG